MEQIFKFQNLPVRVITENDEQSWFPGVDICNILGYAMPSNIIKDNLDEDERKLTNLPDGSGQTRKTWIVNESGLYSLILSSSKPEAKAFKKWVTHEVLPSIRKAGKFTTEDIKFHELNLKKLTSEISSLQIEKSNLQSQLAHVKKQIGEKTSELHAEINMDKTQLKIQFSK